jgi:hypothetical protein
VGHAAEKSRDGQTRVKLDPALVTRFVAKIRATDSALDEASRKLHEIRDKMARPRHLGARTGWKLFSALNHHVERAGGSYEEYGAAVKSAIAHGWIMLHPSGGYLTFTQAGADLFA